MDFFERQDAARRKTALLVGYFLAAVALIIMGIYCVVMGLFFYGSGKLGRVPAGTAADWHVMWNPQVLLVVAGATGVLILLGSLYKIQSLSSGGAAVAELLGGRLLQPGTTDLDERTLLNVVEEMAIASGTPVPAVYVLDQEEGINAFAAGFSTGDAVIGVTRGCLELLSRDELQGVIAHEFSHILNGDMRLNVRLIGVLFGILLISMVGYIVVRSVAFGGVRSRRRSKDGGGALALILLGVALIVIGYVGVFFGRLIKAAVSRQREFLADASAVQFTRNPSGIAGALKKIGGLITGSRIRNAHAEEASHMFFGNALRASFLNLLSTHPPLTVRIQRIDPSFDGSFPKVVRRRRSARELRSERPGRVRHLEAIRARRAAAAPAMAATPLRFGLTPEQATDSVGTVDTEHIDYASALVASLPERLTAEVHEPFGARAVVYGLLLDDDAEVRHRQLERLRQHADPAVYQSTEKLMDQLGQVSPEMRLPLAGMAIPALRSLSPEQYVGFRANVRHLAEADQRISLFEYALHRLLLNHLGPHFRERKPPVIQFYSLRPLLGDCSTVLSALAYVGQRQRVAAERAFRVGADRVGRAGQRRPEMVPPERAGLRAVDRALTRLAQASPQVKKRVLDACAACIAADGRVTVHEAELLRTIADSLGCPMPPALAAHTGGSQPATSPSAS